MWGQGNAHSKCFRENRLQGVGRGRDPNYFLTRAFDAAVLKDPCAASLLLISRVSYYFCKGTKFIYDI